MTHRDTSGIRSALSDLGFAHIPDLSPYLDGIEPDEQKFRAHWDGLVLDENFKSYTTRHRRILRYFYTPPHCLVLNPSAEYVSSVNYDIEYTQGANYLTYATQDFIDDPLMSAILRVDLSLISDRLEAGASYLVDIDLFRVSSKDGQSAPTTSGRHQDGQDWLFMHFIGADYAKPVVSEVTEGKDSEQTLFDAPMAGFLETLCVDDRRLWHAASPVEQINPKQPAWRDLLLVSVQRAANPKSSGEAAQ